MQVEQILDHPLNLWVIKPRHFCDFREQNDDHFGDLLVQIRFFLHHKVDQEVLDAQLLLDRDLGPVDGEDLLESRHGNKLHKFGL